MVDTPSAFNKGQITSGEAVPVGKVLADKPEVKIMSRTENVQLNIYKRALILGALAGLAAFGVLLLIGLVG